MGKFAALLAGLLALFILTGRCFAWNSTGHEIVAQVAYDRLSPGAKTKIAAVLNLHPRLNEDLLMDAAPGEDHDLAVFLRASTWPDLVRFPTNPLRPAENHPHWHYVDYPFDLEGAQGPEPVEKWDGRSDPANILQAFEKIQKELANLHTAADRRAIDLCWIEHLVGDIHQPLHATSLYSKEFPRGDQGGNLMIVRTGQNLVLPLHTFWDDVEGLSLDPEEIRKIADRVEKNHPADEFKDRMMNGDVIAWAKESFAIAGRKVYLNGALAHVKGPLNAIDPQSVPALPEGYEADAVAVADERMALAGYRLAVMLEDIARGL